MSYSQRTPTRSLVWFVAAVAVCMLSACFSSVSPFVSAADVAYDARLVGTWSDSEGKQSAVIVRDGDGYNISYTESDGKVGRFHGVLGRLGTRQVLDVFPEDLPRDKSDVYLSLLVKTHGIIILETAETQLTIRALDVEAIKKLLKERPSLVDHIVIPNRFEPKGEDVVLTASTADVRKFLSEIIDRPGVLEEPESWRRK
jgi:hypothetical protein